MHTVSEQRRVNGISGITYILDILERNDTNRQYYSVYHKNGKRIIGYLRRAGLTNIFFSFFRSLSLFLHVYILRACMCVYCVYIYVICPAFEIFGKEKKNNNDKFQSSILFFLYIYV